MSIAPPVVETADVARTPPRRRYQDLVWPSTAVVSFGLAELTTVTGDALSGAIGHAVLLLVLVHLYLLSTCLRNCGLDLRAKRSGARFGRLDAARTAQLHKNTRRLGTQGSRLVGCSDLKGGSRAGPDEARPFRPVLKPALRRGRSRRFVAVLAVASLSRILTVALPAGQGALGARVAVTGVPFLLATLLLFRLPDFDWRTLRLWPREGLWWQLAIASSGVLIGGLTVIVHLPDYFLPDTSPLALTFTALSLALCSALPEELLYRGLLVPAAREVFGAAGPAVAAGVFAVSYLGIGLGIGNGLFIVIAGLSGAFFGWCYERTGSLLGAVLAHAVINVGVFLVWPGLLRGLEAIA